MVSACSARATRQASTIKVALGRIRRARGSELPDEEQATAARRAGSALSKMSLRQARRLGYAEGAPRWRRLIPGRCSAKFRFVPRPAPGTSGQPALGGLDGLLAYLDPGQSDGGLSTLAIVGIVVGAVPLVVFVV